MTAKKIYNHYEFSNEFNELSIPPAYLIYGADNYQKDKMQKMITEKFSDIDSNDFDFVIFYGDEYDGKKKPIDILEQLESPPFLAKRRVVVLKNFDAMQADNISLIAKYLQKPLKTSILILIGEKIDKRVKANKIIVEASINIQCYPPYNVSSISQWVRSELIKKKIKMDIRAIDLFVNSIELDYLIASNELEKLIIYSRNSGTISIEDVQETVGKSQKKKVFDLQNSISKKNLKSSLIIIENMFTNTNEKIGIFVVTMLTRYFITIWKISSLRRKNLSDSEISSRYLKDIFYKFRSNYFEAADFYTIKEIKGILTLLYQADFDLKSKNIDEKIILEPMIINICKGNI